MDYRTVSAASNGHSTVTPTISTAPAGSSPAPAQHGTVTSGGAAPAPLRPLDIWAVLGVTAYLVALGLGAVVGTIWAFGVAGQLSATTTVVTVTWIGPDFDASPLTGALLLAIVGAVVGSLVHAGHLFSRRVGRHTFESSYVVWYLLRPLLSALLGMAFVAVLRGGLANLGPQGVDSSTPVLAFASGALAGLFLDTVLQKLRAILGATAVDTKATGQDPPE